MHITEPVPVLPENLVTLQPILSRMLAKQPDDRYQNGRQLAEAIERLERAIAAGEHPELADAIAANADDLHFGGAHPTTFIDDQRPMPGSTRPTTPVAALHHRTDPALGRLDDLGETGSYRAVGRGAGRHAAKRSADRRSWIIPAASVLALALLGGAAWHWQDRLRTLVVPNTQVNDTIARAQRALAEGKLLGAGGARELFQSVRAQDADDERARDGLNQVGQRLLADARVALQKHDFAAAREHLDAANDVLGGGAQVEEVKTALDAAQTQGTQVENLLARADAALAANRLLGSDGAATLYRQILDADAGNAVARHGLDKVAAAQAQLARDALAQGDAELAGQRLAQLAELAPNHAAIPELRSALAKRREADAQTQAQQQNPQPAPQRPVPQKPIQQKSQPPAQPPQRQQAAQTTRAERTRQREAREQDEAQQDSQREPSLAERARIEDLLAEADRALSAGDLMDPGGAYDKYRAVLGIDGYNTRALQGLKQIAPRARALFDQAISAGKPNNARGYLDAIADTDPGNPALIGLRARLGEVYYDQADRFVGEGRRGEAMRALNTARQLSPSSPRSAALEAKIESLPAGG